jgi:hypothetical protein
MGVNSLGEMHWRIGIIVAMILLKTKFESHEKKCSSSFEVLVDAPLTTLFEKA